MKRRSFCSLLVGLVSAACGLKSIVSRKRPSVPYNAMETLEGGVILPKKYRDVLSQCETLYGEEHTILFGDPSAPRPQGTIRAT